MEYDLRGLITLIEEKSQGDLKQIKLPYGKGSLAPVLSAKSVEYHYGHLYRAYVDHYNDKEGDRSFNEAGAYLHGLYFGQFRSPNTQGPKGSLRTLIEKHHGSLAGLKKAMKDAALKLQGSGWVYLSRSGKIKTIHNHQKRTDIVLIIDMWEHAWALDYQADKKRYLDRIWQIMNWETIQHRL